MLADSTIVVMKVCWFNTTGSSVEVLNIQKICYRSAAHYSVKLLLNMDCWVPWVTAVCRKHTRLPQIVACSHVSPAYLTMLYSFTTTALDCTQNVPCTSTSRFVNTWLCTYGKGFHKSRLVKVVGSQETIPFLQPSAYSAGAFRMKQHFQIYRVAKSGRFLCTP